MLLYWIPFLLTFCPGRCQVVCSTVSGGVTIVATCADDEHCCEGNTSCCSGLSTTAIAAMTSCSAIIVVVIVILVVYHIQQKKKPSVQDENSEDKIYGQSIQAPPNRELYDCNDSGRGIPSPRQTSTSLPNTEFPENLFERRDLFFRHPSPDRLQMDYKMFQVDSNGSSRDNLTVHLPDMNSPEYKFFSEEKTDASPDRETPSFPFPLEATDISRDHVTSILPVVDSTEYDPVSVESTHATRDHVTSRFPEIEMSE